MQTAPPPRDVLAKASGHDRSAFADEARAAGRFPYFRETSSGCEPRTTIDGRPRIQLGSNNYLGLTRHPAVRGAAREALDRYGTGLTGSRLLNGTTQLHLELEAELAAWMGTEAALVYTTGHHANLGALGTLLGPDDIAILDASAHASLHDGCGLSGARRMLFRHGDLDGLELCLRRAAGAPGGALVVVDGLFSMEGDVAPLPQIADLCERYDARLMVDEAHALGVLGDRGAGASELWGVEDRVALRMGTFSKSLASVGGFIAGSADVVDFLRLQSRSFLFTASGAPASIAAALAAVRIARSAEGRELMRRVRSHARRLRGALDRAGWAMHDPGTGPDGITVPSPIVALRTGHDDVTLDTWNALFDAGVFVNAALFPAVRRGHAVLRASVMATHDDADIDDAVAVFAGLDAPAVPPLPPSAVRRALDGAAGPAASTDAA